jgi:hypothetical protein
VCTPCICGENIIMKYSIIVLLEEKSEDFSQFVRMLYETFSSRPDPFEIIIMANGTEGFLKIELEKLPQINHHIKAFSFNKKTTQAVCLKAAVKESRSEIIVACGSYQQIKKNSIIKLLDSLDEKTDIISPWRQDRVDPPFNQFQSNIFNFIVRKITGSDLHDLSCSVKIFRRRVLEDIELYGNMYRFLPIIANQKGFRNKEVKCEHAEERGRSGFYGFSEYLTRILDIFTLYFNTRFTRKPLRFFSTIGSMFILIGLIINLYILSQKIFLGNPIGDRHSLLIAVLFMVMGIQVASIGLLGEIIVFTHGRQKKEYSIEKEI